MTKIELVRKGEYRDITEVGAHRNNNSDMFVMNNLYRDITEVGAHRNSATTNAMTAIQGTVTLRKWAPTVTKWESQ